MMAFRTMEPENSYVLDRKAFDDAFERALGKYYPARAAKLASFKDALYNALSNPIKENGNLRTAFMICPEKEAGYFRNLAAQFNIAFGKNLLSFEESSAPGGKKVEIFLNTEDFTAQQIKSAYFKLTDPASRSAIVPFDPDPAKEGSASNAPAGSAPGTSASFPAPASPETSSASSSGTSLPISPGTVPSQVEQKKAEFVPDKFAQERIAKRESIGPLKFEPHPLDANVERANIPAVAGIRVEEQNIAVFMPHFTLEQLMRENAMAQNRDYLRRVNSSMTALFDPGYSIGGGASTERDLTYVQRLIVQTDAFEAFFRARIWNLMDAKAKAMWGVSLTELGGRSPADQLDILQYGMTKKQLSALPASKRKALLANGDTRMFAYTETEKTALVNSLASQFHCSKEDAADIADYYAFSANNLRPAGIRLAVSTSTMDEPEFKLLKQKFLTATGTRKISISYLDAMLGHDQGALQLSLGATYVAPGCGKAGADANSAAQAAMVERLLLSESENRNNPNIPLVQLQSRLQSGELPASTAYLEMVRRGIIVYDPALKAAVLCPSKYAWFDANGKLRQSDTKPAGVPESALTGGLYGKAKFRRLSLSSSVREQKMAKAMDDAFYAEDRRVQIQITEQSQIIFKVIFGKTKPEYSPEKGFSFNFIVDYQAPGGGEIRYFKEKMKREGQGQESVKSEINLDALRVSRSSGGEKFELIEYVPYIVEEKNGKKVKRPLKKNAARSNAEIELVYEYDKTTGTGSVSIAPLAGRKLDYGATYEVCGYLSVNEAEAIGAFRATMPPKPPEPVIEKPPEIVPPEPKPIDIPTKKKEPEPAQFPEYLPRDPQMATLPYPMESGINSGMLNYKLESGYDPENGEVNFGASSLPFKQLNSAVPALPGMVNSDGVPKPNMVVDYHARVHHLQMYYCEKGNDEMLFIGAGLPADKLSKLPSYKQMLPLSIDEKTRRMEVDWGLVPSHMRPPKGSPEEALQGTYIGVMPPRGKMVEQQDGRIAFEIADSDLEIVSRAKNPLLSGAFAAYSSLHTCARKTSKDEEGKEIAGEPFVSSNLYEAGFVEGKPFPRDSIAPPKGNIISYGVPSYIIELQEKNGYAVHPELKTYSLGYIKLDK